MTVTSLLRLGYTEHPAERISIWHGSRQPGGIPVIMCHGLLADATQWYDTPSQALRIARASAERNVTAFGSDLGGLSTWGNDDYIAAMDDTIAWGAANYGTRTDAVAVYGTSMGGCCLNWVWRNPTRVVACVLTIPVVDLAGIHDRNPLGIGDLIEDAYGGASGYYAALPAHDPSHPNNTAILARMADRIRVYYSGNDNVVDATEVIAFAAATGITAVNAGNVGHSLVGSEHLAAGWLLDWIDPPLPALTVNGDMTVTGALSRGA